MNENNRSKLYLEPLDTSQPGGSAVRPSADLAALAAVRSADDAKSGVESAAERDPLLTSPRKSSVVLCLVFAVLLALAAAGVWALSVNTVIGQQYDNMAYANCAEYLPGPIGAAAAFLARSVAVGSFSVSYLAFADVLLAVVALVVVIVRRRWWLLGTLVVCDALAFAVVEVLKHVLPRTTLDMSSLADQGNTAPSGHAAVAMIVAVSLLLVVPRVWRAVVAVIVWLYALVGGLSVVVGGWHRPSDALMSYLLVGAFACLMLAVTRRSAMDDPGTRVSSTSIQIVGTIMITAGIIGVGYGSYVIWQLIPGLEYNAKWAASSSVVSALIVLAATGLLLFGVLLAMRHITAAPLSKMGLVGAPPTPPSRR